MQLNIADFQIPEGTAIDLRKWPTRVDPLYGSKKEYRKLLAGQTREMIPLQRLHYAFNRYALLLIFQDTVETPWYAIPADDKRNARLIISSIILNTFNSLKMAYPTSDANRRDELCLIREALMERKSVKTPCIESFTKEN